MTVFMALWGGLGFGLVVGFLVFYYASPAPTGAWKRTDQDRH